MERKKPTGWNLKSRCLADAMRDVAAKHPTGSAAVKDPNDWKDMYYVYLMSSRDRGYYVGMSSRSARFNEHLNLVSPPSVAVREWVREFSGNIHFVILYFEELKEGDGDQFLRVLKAETGFVRRGAGKLLNKRTGSGHSPETRKIMSEKASGKNNPFYGRTHTQELKDNHSKKFSGSGNPRYGVRGKKHPSYGTKWTDEQRAARSGPNNHFFGKKHTAEARKKQGAKNVGRVPTEEQREKMSRRMSGSNNPMSRENIERRKRESKE